MEVLNGRALRLNKPLKSRKGDKSREDGIPEIKRHCLGSFRIRPDEDS